MRLDQRQQHVECAAAQLERLAVGEQLPAVRQHLETAEDNFADGLGCRAHSNTVQAGRRRLAEQIE